MKTKLFITVLSFIAITSLASAQNIATNQVQQKISPNGSGYVDTNKNGICDNRENRVANMPGGKRNGNSSCCCQGKRHGKGQMSAGKGHGNSRNFVDTDYNGICDFYDASSKK
jgi:hypothetical protein